MHKDFKYQLVRLKSNILHYVMVCLFILTSITINANHIVGGNLTWACLGTGEYIFQVKLTIDCNANVGQPGVNQIKVWNHPTISSINVSYVSETDLSPNCNVVSGGPLALSCNTPLPGTLKEFLYQSAPITITGVPPAQGFHFTYSNFSRGNAIDNITNPTSTGITLHASMYAYNGLDASPCFDSSPDFSTGPLNTVCQGSELDFSLGAIDVDSDSLVYSLTDPLNDDLVSIYNPPVEPSLIPWGAGYNSNNPLPGIALNPNNFGPAVDPLTGLVSFEIHTLGYFLLTVKVESYRCGQKISVVNQEMVVNIMNCSFANTSPNISINGITGNTVTVNAGDLVTFSVDATDGGLLQDGSAQNITVSAAGDMFGAGFSSTVTGCDRPPCAVISGGLPQNGSGNLIADFSWQTSCDHVAFNCDEPQHTYYFNFTATDDVCEIPMYGATTVKVKVLNLPPTDEPELRCLSVDPSGNVDVTWIPVDDPLGSFLEYRIYASSGGSFNLIGTESNRLNTVFTHTGANAQLGPVSYVVSSISDCSGATEKFSLDTLNTIFLDVVNPSNGTAVLQWNHMSNPILSTANNYYYIYMEYPTGSWQLIDSVDTSISSYLDTIDICDAFINYQITLNDQSGCISHSNINGDQFQDVLPPDIPVITYVSVDTISNNAYIEWNSTNSQDTYAYIISQNINGFWQIIDTVYGYNNTSYLNTNTSNVNAQIDMYGIAAFDSCISVNPNTSPVGIPHRTILLETALNICDLFVDLNWNTYSNWINGVDFYNLYYSENGGNWNMLAQLNANDSVYQHLNVNPQSTYSYIVEAIENGSEKSISNIANRFIHQPPLPSFSYLQSVTVVNDLDIEVRYHADENVDVSGYKLFRSDDEGANFDFIEFTSNITNPILFFDQDVEPDVKHYFYKVSVVDSCQRTISTSNIGKSILLKAESETGTLINQLDWTNYMQWDGAVDRYDIYRKVNGVYELSPIANVSAGILEYNDDVDPFIGTDADGHFCYKIIAHEQLNSYGIMESSESNEVCTDQDPIIFVPNAIYIDGINNTWKPVVNLMDFTDYHVYVYNRLNHLVYETTDKFESWDGTYSDKNTLVPLGVYVYFVEFKNGRGDFFRKQGHITVIR